MQKFIGIFLLGMLAINAEAAFNDEERKDLKEQLNRLVGPVARAASGFAAANGINDPKLAKALVIAWRNSGDLPEDMIREFFATTRGSSGGASAAAAAATGTGAARADASYTTPPSGASGGASAAAASATGIGAARADASYTTPPSGASGGGTQEMTDRKLAEELQQKEERNVWLQETFLIGPDRAAIGGFEGVKDRLDIFNPLYGGKSHEERKFPNVPVVHQYDPETSSSGGFFPLVVKLSLPFFSRLPETINTHFPHQPTEVYWSVQKLGSIIATGRGDDNLVFRPQYWVQPNGNPINFRTDAHLLGPDGTHHHLGAVGYSIHNGVASPNAPTIPFQDRLRSGESASFWSSVSHGGKTAITCHWILGNGEDERNMEKAIHDSTTMQELLNKIRLKRFLPKMVEEIESVFGR